MIELIQWPPLHYATYSLLGRKFEQTGDEPFVTYMLDGSVDTDLTRQAPGFINRIQRFGIQNKLPKIEWDEQTILYSLLPKMSVGLRGKYFRHTLSGSQKLHTALMSARVHTAPVPQGMAEAAGFAGVADNDPDLPRRLATLNPDKWNAVLRKWVMADPERKSKTVAGPAWWWALHSVAMNPTPTTAPNRFVGVWIGMFPCRLCRLGARVYIARHPVPGWEHFESWAAGVHDYVTHIKN